ncbi:DUF4247 domain-containing protein [Mycobacterium spongiae]|uniref:DUF4247 domain-containing protein n=1 Tax=Mycobacterium spongiae TaxID=886343 RepID=A0A975JXF5_9MYCO|nr:DUF4247 domain-containing protein [Mycobacterium spongiae]QUR67158.1 DUF4247 domain-containing protein [Mycobacterium spongiae]
MSRNRMFVVAGALALAATVALIFGINLLSKDIGTYIAANYREVSRDVNGTNYLCGGSRAEVVAALTKQEEPAARASYGTSEYLRFRRKIVIIGPNGGYPCIIRVEKLSGGYNHGAFIFLGPGFYPGAPSRGSGGSSGGPGGSK